MHKSDSIWSWTELKQRFTTFNKVKKKDQISLTIRPLRRTVFYFKLVEIGYDPFLPFSHFP